MVSVSDIVKNISSGQSAIRTSSIKRDLDNFFEKIRSNIRLQFAKVDGTGTVMYFNLPTTDYPHIFYDVTIMVNTTKRITNDTLLKIYSNSPAFAFNYCYLFYHSNSLLFPEKYPEIFLTEPPKVRNPLQTKAFDKHVYACLKSLNKIHVKDVTLKFEGAEEPDPMSFSDKLVQLKKVSADAREGKEIK